MFNYEKQNLMFAILMSEFQARFNWNNPLNFLSKKQARGHISLIKITILTKQQSTAHSLAVDLKFLFVICLGL